MNNSKLVTKNLTTSGLITSKLATKPSPGNDDGTIDKDNSKSKDSVTPFLTFQPSVTNHYMCQVCTDESSHCNAHTSTSIGAELGRTRDFEQDDEDDDFYNGNNRKSSFQYSASNPQQEWDGSDEEANDVVVRSSFYVRGICCASEIPAIRKIVRRFPGVQRVAVNTMTRTVYVHHASNRVSATTLMNGLNNERFGASILKDGAKKFDEGGDGKSKGNNINKAIITVEPVSKYTSWIQMCLDYSSGTITDGIDRKYPHPFVLISGLCWGISMLSFYESWDDLKYFGLASVFFGIPPIAVKSYFTIRRYQLDATCNMCFATIGALALGEFTEAAAVCFLFSISEYLEKLATGRARTALNEIVKLRPESAVIIDNSGELRTIPADSIQVGDQLIVKNGEKVPCDGLVIKGGSLLDESSLTGEARPVKKLVNDAVSGGTVNVGSSPITIRANSTVSNSAIARLIQLVEEAQTNRSPTEKFVDSFAQKFTPCIVGLALILCTVPWVFGSDLGRTWSYNALVIVVIACPCALVISTPVTYVAGLAATAKRGIIIKGGSHLEALGRVRRVVFDKTGTLTEGRFALLNFGVVGNSHSYTEVLKLLAAIEQPSSHPLASALVQAAKSEGVKLNPNTTIEEHTLIKGEGITAKVDGKEMFVGNRALAERFDNYKFLPPQAKRLANEWSNLGGTVGFIGIKGESIIGIYCVTDNIRKEAPFVIGALDYLGVDVHLLTGDDYGPARAVAKQIGIPEDNIQAQLLPEDKLRFIEKIKEPDVVNKSALLRYKGGRTLVLMCGDGVNDAPAIAAANVGVSMGSGAAVAMETSNITLMDSNLNKLLLSIYTGRKVNRVIKQNIFFSVFTKATVIFFTLYGSASLWAAIAADVGTMLAVTLNGMKLLPRDREEYDMEGSGIVMKGDAVTHLDESFEIGDEDVFVDLAISKEKEAEYRVI